MPTPNTTPPTEKTVQIIRCYYSGGKYLRQQYPPIVSAQTSPDYPDNRGIALITPNGYALTNNFAHPIQKYPCIPCQ